ncbi:deoxyribonuclease IV [Longirhabdus pacifica]|uniref:deoxyribonuclease IV n=1 Tax=Longirhabdus pacifica TaxID=2305227 RepID=UPI001008C317|nr:deoxyribonuclease IV [Longirhabdus pacifica]
MRYGCHLSIKNGYLQAAKTAKKLNIQAFQYFPKNPRSLSIKTFDVHDAAECASFCKAHNIVSVAHAAYPTNLTVHDPKQQLTMMQSIWNELTIAEACGSLGLVLHFGKFSGEDTLQTYRNSLQCIHAICSQWNGKAKLLIENDAGGTSGFGSTFEESVTIRNLSQHQDKIGFCLDTCHLFSSGVWDGNNHATWDKASKKDVWETYKNHVHVVHVNDSMYPSGSGKDRHANVGKGHIGLDSLQSFLTHFNPLVVPFILETPYSKTGEKEQELHTLSQLIQRSQ